MSTNHAAIDRAAALLRPHPHRGDIIAAGAVPLTVALLLIDVRFAGKWDDGVLFAVMALAAALMLGMGLLARMEEEAPRAYQSALFLSGLALAAAAILRLADVLGASGTDPSSGTALWMGTMFAALALVPALRRNSAICTLVAALAGVIVAIAFVDWVFAPDSTATFRWILLVVIIAYGLAFTALRDHRRRHAVALLNAAGLATLALAATFALRATVGPLRGGGGAGTGWELVLAAMGFALVAYAGVDREPGPGYLGVAVLAAFLLVAGPASFDGPSLIGWPLLLLLAGAAMLVVGLRPIEPLPPEPEPVNEPDPSAGLPTEPLRPVDD